MTTNWDLSLATVQSLGVLAAIGMSWREIRKARISERRRAAEAVTAWVSEDLQWGVVGPVDVPPAIRIYNASGYPIRDVWVDLWIVDVRAPLLAAPLHETCNGLGALCLGTVPPHTSVDMALLLDVSRCSHGCEERFIDQSGSFDPDSDDPDPFRLYANMAFTDYRGTHWLSNNGIVSETRVTAFGNPAARDLFAPSRATQLRAVAASLAGSRRG